MSLLEARLSGVLIGDVTDTTVRRVNTMRMKVGLALVILSTLCGCESEVRRSVKEVRRIMEEAKKKPESMDGLHKLTPYLEHDAAFVRATACQAIGDIYGGTQDEDISARCETILCETG